jgi:two-component system, CitB family, sensor histidine kinase DctS
MHCEGSGGAQLVAWWRHSSLRHKIVALTTALVVLAFCIGLVLLGHSILDSVENEVGRRAMSVAQAVAQVESLKENLGRADGARVIQPAAERMRLAAGVDYITVFDMNRIRYSHTLPERIGTRFEGGDEGPSLSQQAYISRAIGVNGPSIRAFAPVLSTDGSEQKGVVVVGMLVPPLSAVLFAYKYQLLIALAAGLGVAVLGASFLAASIKRQMFGLEPPEIARLVEERGAVFSALGEGLIAIDRDGYITVMNDEAQRIVGAGPGVIGRNVLDVIAHSRLPETLASGQADYGQQMLLGRTIVVVNRVPVRIQDRIVGAVATFRDRTEVTRLAGELTGVTRFVEALRAQNHESANKMHTVAGMIQLRKYEQALDYIFSVTERQQEVARFLARRIRDYRVSGLLLGKIVHGRETGVELIIDPQSRLEAVPPPLDGGDLVLLLGNLIENAMEALTGRAEPRRVDCFLQGDAHRLTIRVSDNGPGVPPNLREQIFTQGFSTKGEHRGLGLALVAQLVDFAGGKVALSSEPGRTVFTIQILAREEAV